MKFTRRRVRLEYKISQVIVLILAISAAIGFQRLLESNGVPAAGLIAALAVMLPGLYAYYTFRFIYRLFLYRDYLRADKATSANVR